ncbi:MAG: uroporphyrinogen-III C-methyltransferase [Spongiibacteraceae bacterium]|nr:uroporphyrinogen-III C-methyltransferase [Spongiibacteraceae bacterium]
MEDNLPVTKDQPAASDEKNKQANKTADVGSSVQQGPSKATGPGWIAWGVSLSIALGSAGASVYFWQNNERAEQYQQQLQANVAGAIQRIDEQSNLARSLQREMDQNKNIVKQQQLKIQQGLERLQRQQTNQQKRILALSTTDRSDWLLAEAEYLMRLASQRLLMGKEVRASQALLKAADDIIRELDDSALYPVRQALADEISALHASARFDLEGVYLQLGAVAGQAEHLRLIATLQMEAQVAPEKPSGDWQHRLEAGLQAAWNKLSNYVQVRRRDEIYEPLLAPEYEAAVRQNVKLMFEQAQLALLSGKQSLYEKSLYKAKEWLHRFYTLDEDATAKVIVLVEKLEQEKIAVTVPDISKSLRELKNYIAMMHTIQSNKSPAPEIIKESSGQTL